MGRTLTLGASIACYAAFFGAFVYLVGFVAGVLEEFEAGVVWGEGSGGDAFRLGFGLVKEIVAGSPLPSRPG